jgi:hypothetical protein
MHCYVTKENNNLELDFERKQDSFERVEVCARLNLCKEGIIYNEALK